MNAPMDLQARVQQYLAERRRLGFHLRSPGHALPNFARFVEASKHSGPLTVELMAQWARQAQGGKASAETAASRSARAAGLLHHVRGVVHGFVRVAQHQLRAFGGEQQGRGAADARAGAGDDRHLVFECLVHVRLRLACAPAGTAALAMIER